MDYRKKFSSATEDIKHKISDKEKEIIVSFLVVFFLFFCYLATLPKHPDFQSILYPGKVFASGVYDLSPYLLENARTIHYGGTPLLGILSGIWIKAGLLFFSVNPATWTFGTLPAVMQNWCMIPYLFMLVVLTAVSFNAVRNKWLTFLCFGTFPFVSIIIMGQIDIWDTLWIFIAILLALKAIGTENNLKFIILSIFALGLSMQFKPFGGLVLPVFLFFFWWSFREKHYPAVRLYGILLVLVLEFAIVSFWQWVVWFPHLFSGGLLGETSWLLNLQLAPVQLPAYHTLSIWLLGYIIMLYDMVKRSESANRLPVKKLFILYVFSALAWFFISVYTHPQWWMVLIPPFVLVLDTFSSKFNYLFYVCVSVLFLFYPLQWTNNIEKIVKFYMPVFPVTGNFSIIIVTLLSAVLLLWMFELRQETLEHTEMISPEHSTGPFFSLPKIAPLLPAVLIVLLFLVVSLILPTG
ncbi:MAG: hypothetical protein LUO98_05905 [Methanoregula sp.]|nr:hypothetical protein [Methanoregula sp.]